MSDSRKAVEEDYDEYTHLCEQYNETPIGYYGNWYNHLSKLQEKRQLNG